jgi:hypothetical protein
MLVKGERGNVRKRGGRFLGGRNRGIRGCWLLGGRDAFVMRGRRRRGRGGVGDEGGGV